MYYLFVKHSWLQITETIWSQLKFKGACDRRPYGVTQNPEYRLQPGLRTRNETVLLSASRSPFCSFLLAVPRRSGAWEEKTMEINDLLEDLRNVPEETKCYSKITFTFKRCLILLFNFLLGVTKGRQYSTWG